MIRCTLIICAALLAVVFLCAGAAAPARASSQNAQMREALMAVRGLIDRAGAAAFFTYPLESRVRPGDLGSSWWPTDPWTGEDMTAGAGRGHFRYRVSADRRHYRLTGLLDGGSVVLTGGMPKTIMLAYDHRSEEGINLIRQYIEDYAAGHAGIYPLPSDVDDDGAVGLVPRHRYWPSNPWDHFSMAQRADHGSFSYAVAADRKSYSLRLHRALRHDYVLTGATVMSPWQQLLGSLDDEMLRRSGKIFAGYATALTAHLHSGDYLAGGVAPSPARGSGPSEP